MCIRDRLFSLAGNRWARKLKPPLSLGDPLNAFLKKLSPDKQENEQGPIHELAPADKNPLKEKTTKAKRVYRGQIIR